MRILTYRKSDRARAVNKKRHTDNAGRVRLHVSKGDEVMVVRGEHKGTTGKILRVNRKTSRVVVQGVNLVKKHRRARNAEEQSGIIEMEAPIHVSNVMLIDPKSGEPTRVRRRTDEDGTKERISVKSGDAIPRPAR
jgi:large subunit ribosomal protein L24